MSEAIDQEDDSWPLTEVEPSPIEDTPQETRDSYFPTPKEDPPPQPIIKRISSLGLANHGVPYYLTRAQKYSSYTFTVFATLHFTNTAVIPLLTRSVPDASTYLLLTRPYYQSFPLEPLLIGLPLATHIGSGIALRLYRRSQNLHRYGSSSLPVHEQDRRRKGRGGWPKVSGISALGFALTPLVIGHAFVNRGIPQLRLGDSSTVGLEYVSHAFARHPAVSFVGFTALMSVTAWHVVWGWAKWLNLTPAQVTDFGGMGQQKRKKRWYLLNAASAIVAGLWLAGGLGVVGRGGEVGGWLGREYDELYGSIPIVGRWLG